MADPADNNTQPLSQEPEFDVPLTDEDIADTLCHLQPVSAAATRLVKAMFVQRPQHVVVTKETLKGAPVVLSLALRFSSDLLDYGRGFSFGRSAELNEIVLDFEGTQKRISQIHFQVYVNSHNVLMLRDTSTNGTIVDGTIVGGKRVEGNSSTRTLGADSSIEILSPIGSEAIRFKLNWPARDQNAKQYTDNFAQWIELVRAAENKAWLAHAQLGALIETRPVGFPGVYINPGPLPRSRSMFKDQPPNMDDTFGMVWDGGNDYKCIGQIGSGAFATVYQVSSRLTGEVFAVKELEKRRFVKNGLLDRHFDNEMQIMRTLRHPHIVQFIDFVELRNHLYIIMELVHFGDLQGFIKKYGNLNEDLGKQMSFQMLDALDYLHGMNITHRDIKPENILISDYSPFTVKLTDFGLSKVVKNEETFLKTFCGTLLYCAPEVFPHYDAHAAGVRSKRPRREQPQVGRRSYSQQIDIWSYGVVLWAALSGVPPFEGKADATGHAMFNQIMKTELETWRLRQLDISEEAIDLLVQMLDTNPVMRPTEEMCFQHPWLAGMLEPSKEELVDQTDTTAALDASQLSLNDYKDDEDVDESSPSFGSFKEGDLKRQRGESSKIPRNESGFEAKGKSRLPTDVQPYKSPRRSPIPPPKNMKEYRETEELAIKSSGALGEGYPFGTDGAWDHYYWKSGTTTHEKNTEQVTRQPITASQTQNLTDSEFETFLNNSQRAVVVEHRLVYGHHNGTEPLQYEVTKPPRSSSASSLSGAEAMVKNLRVTSLETNNASSELLPDAPSTPKQAAARLDDTEIDEDAIITPKQVHFQRTTEDIPISNSLFYDDDEEEDDYSKSENAVSLEVSNDIPNSASKLKANPEDQHTLAKISQLDLNSVSDRTPLLPPFGTEFALPSSTTSNKENERNHKEDASNLSSALSSNNNPFSSSPAFAKPSLLLGRLATTPNSFMDLTLPLSKRVTTWGRHPENTIVYANAADTRIPKVGLEIWFHARGIDDLERAGQDWTKMEDLEVIVRTRSRYGIRVNGVHLAEKDQAGTLLYGKLFTGDEITVSSAKEGSEVLKFVCDFTTGRSAAKRGASNAKFVVFTSTL